MHLPDGYHMRDAAPADLELIGELRRSVGWVVHDWAVRVVLAPPARTVLVFHGDGEVAAVGSGMGYGELGWVGNMVVAERHRRRGLGTVVLQEIVRWLEDAGCRRLELYATTDGRPLYARNGFDLVEPSLMVRIPRSLALDPPARPSTSVEVAHTPGPWLERITAFDAPRFGGDRRMVLAALPIDRDAPLLIARRGGDVVGYAWLRPEHERLGPFVADEPDIAAALVAAAFGATAHAPELAFNMSSANEAGRRWLATLGVDPEPWEGRMARGRRIDRRDDTIYGNAVGALG